MWGWRGFSSVEPDQSRATRLRLVAAKLNLYKLVRWWLNSSLDGGISFFVSKLRNSILCIFTFFFATSLLTDLSAFASSRSSFQKCFGVKDQDFWDKRYDCSGAGRPILPLSILCRHPTFWRA